MSSSSIARQNRRMRLKQVSSASSSKTTESLTLATTPPDPEMRFNGTNETSSNSAKEQFDHASTDNLECVSGKPNISAASDGSETVGKSIGCSYINCGASSQPLGKIFIEEESGFKAVDASMTFQLSDNGCMPQNVSTTEQAIDLASRTAEYFHNLSNFCHGLLGGMSFLHFLLLLHFMSSQQLDEETIRHFSFLSQPVHNVFNFLCIICCVSAFDRYNIGNPRQLLKFLKTCNLKIIILLIYPLCLLLSLSTANVDEKLCVPELNSTILESFKLKDAENELFYWKTLSLSKSMGAFLAWIVIALEPNYNLFLNQLKFILEKNKSSYK